MRCPALPRAPAPAAGRRQALLALAAITLGATACPARASSEIQRWPSARPMPAFSADDLEGRPWRLDALRGRAVLLNFWASWCEPCRSEMPSLQRLVEFHGEDRLAVITINFKESPAQATRFMRRAGLRLPVVADPQGLHARAWEVSVFPTTILIGVDGRPKYRIRGEVDWNSPEADRIVSALMMPA